MISGDFVSAVKIYCHVRNKIMCVLSWRTQNSLTRPHTAWLFPSLLRNSGNSHEVRRLVSEFRIRHSSPYIILYIRAVFTNALDPGDWTLSVMTRCHIV